MEWRRSRNGIVTSDCIWFPECPVGQNPASAFSFLGHKEAQKFTKSDPSHLLHDSIIFCAFLCIFVAGIHFISFPYQGGDPELLQQVGDRQDQTPSPKA